MAALEKRNMWYSALGVRWKSGIGVMPRLFESITTDRITGAVRERLAYAFNPGKCTAVRVMPKKTKRAREKSHTIHNNMLETCHILAPQSLTTYNIIGGKIGRCRGLKLVVYKI